MATDPLTTIIATMLACAEAHLTTDVGRAVVMPGNTVAWDDCCEGQVWVRIVSIVGASGLSRPAMQPCLPLYQVRVGVGVVRCAHTVDDQGNPPSPAEMASDAFQTYRDRADLVESVVCCMDSITGVETLRIEDWLPVGPEGGCVGGEITITFNHILCTPCTEEDC